MTDHHGGFNHRVNPENYNFIKNLHEEKEWYEIIEKYFTIETWHKLFWHQNIESEDFKPHVMYDANGDEYLSDYYTVLGSENKEEIFNCGNCIGLDFNVFV